MSPSVKIGALLHGRFLHSRSPFVRKGAARILRIPRMRRRMMSTPEDFRKAPPVLCNSFPKSGTHLLIQVLEALPVRNYGRFLASMTSSIRFRPRTTDSTIGFLDTVVPGELLTGHLFHDVEIAECLAAKGVAHYFIMRDLRDVVVSEAHYLANGNPWHRLHRHFKRLGSLEDRILLSIRGMPDEDIDYPDVGKRFGRYAQWLNAPGVVSVRYEELRRQNVEGTIVRIVTDYLQRTAAGPIAVAELSARALDNIEPNRSHTYRSGVVGGWERAFTTKTRDAMKAVAGDLLIQLGYASDSSW